LADELGQPAFGLVVFDIGDEMLLMFQSLLVVFHRGAVEDDLLLVEAVLGKEEIVFDEENGCFFIDGEGVIKKLMGEEEEGVHACTNKCNAQEFS
jgi:hypothetical protein